MPKSMLDKHKLYYEDLPPRKYKLKEGITMSKQAPAVAPAKTYQKSRSEHAKDILIAMLITAIVAFIGGMQFKGAQAEEVRNAVSQAQAQAPATEAKK